MNKKLLIGLVIMLLLSFTSAFAVGTAPDPADALAYWALEDLTDLTGNGNTLTNEEATSGATGIILNAYDFESTNSESISVPSGLCIGATSCTISAWVKPESQVSNTIYRDRPTDILFRSNYNPGSNGVTCQFETAGGSAYAIYGTQTTIPTGTFTHLLCVYDAGTPRIYIDGSEVTPDTLVTGSGAIANNAGNTYLGSNNDVGDFFDGVMDEVSIFDVALTGDEVAYLYQAGIPTSEQQYPFSSVTPQEDILTIIGADADNATDLTNFNVTYDGITYQNATGNIIQLNITALGGNSSELQNFSVTSTNYFSQSVTNWNISSIYYANLTQYPYITAYDEDSNATLSNFNVTIKDILGGLKQSTQTTNGVVYYRCGSTPANCATPVKIYINSTNYQDYSNLGYSFGIGATNDLNASLSPNPLEDFSLLTPTGVTISNGTEYNITWTQAVSPTSKTVTYTGSITYVNNATEIDSFSTTDLFYNLDLSSYPSSDFNVSVTATESFSLDSFTHSSILGVSRDNYLYFYDEDTGLPIESANVTIDYPNYPTDIVYTTNALGEVTFPSYVNNTLQTGNYSITFEDFIGYVTPITFNRDYSGLPINESFNITVTNINITLYYRSNFSQFNKEATVIIEGISNNTISNGSVFLQNASISNGLYRVYVFSDGYFNEQKDFTFTGQDDLNLCIYLLELNNSNSGTVTIRTIDEFQRLLSDATVNLLEYDPSTLSYIEVSECLTDSNGECKFLVQTNTKSYKFTATKGVNGNTVTASTDSQIFEDDISGGQVVLFSEQTITLTLSSQEQFIINAIQNIIFSSTESFNNVTNQSNIDVSFNSIDGTNLQVCVEYFSVAGGVETSLTGSTFCVVGSSAEVTENAFFTLNRSKEYIAKVYIKSGSSEIGLASYRYKSLDSFSQRLVDNATLPFVFLFIWIFLIGGGLALKNVPLTGIFIIAGTWAIAGFFPTITIVSASVLQTLIGISLIYNGRKKEDFQ